MEPIIEIVLSRVWVHESGRQASPYGAAPWTSAEEKQEWSLETRGYTWVCGDGTIGLCRKPAETPTEAREIANKYNAHLESCGRTVKKF